MIRIVTLTAPRVAEYRSSLSADTDARTGEPAEDTMDEDSEQHEYTCININKENEARYWSKTLRVHQAELSASVETVGPLIEDVRAHLCKWRLAQLGYQRMLV